MAEVAPEVLLGFAAAACAVGIVVLERAARREVPTDPPGPALADSIPWWLSPLCLTLAVTLAASPSPKAGLGVLAITWVGIQALALCMYMLIGTLRPDPPNFGDRSFESACRQRVDQHYHPGVARAAVMSVLLVWAAWTV